jgi:hypothetical protein
MTGVIIEGRITNPEEKHLSYYEEIMGLSFQISLGFLTSSLKKWLPRMNDIQRNNLAISIYDELAVMRREGKNDNMLKNAYIKFMCWLYYKFERILNHLGNEKLPKILYEGDISNYELKLLCILANAGCDIVLLQYQGDSNYIKLDPSSSLSIAYINQNGTSFPIDFNINWIQKETEKTKNIQRLYGVLPQLKRGTNQGVNQASFESILKNSTARGNDPNVFYNCFIRILGVEDKITYLNELFQLQLQLKNNKRKVVIVEQSIATPTMDEIAGVKRNNYNLLEQMLLDLSSNLQYTANLELQRLMVKSYLDILMEESNKSELNLNKLTNKAVYLLCWIKRYQVELFLNWKPPEISCFIYLGGCKNEAEVMFLRFLSRLPIDVLVLLPDLNSQCRLNDDSLIEIKYTTSMVVEQFPRENAELHMGTAAYHAERELDSLMYQDSGMYRNRQYEKAVAVILRTMYEEISIMWDQELKYRPNFSVVDTTVNIPVIFSKISGVKDKNIALYWKGVKSLVTSDTYVIENIPFIKTIDSNPIKAHATEFIKNGKLQKGKIKEHQAYQYGFLRDEMQDYILDKLQLLIDLKSIKGTFENGTEYTIISTVLNLSKDIIRLIQNFDFTKKNPKLIYINTTEIISSLEDSIMIAFLNLAGFDILIYVPTGYQNIEKFYNKKMMEEHQIGDYVYDLQPPRFDNNSSSTRPSWREKIFKRGN